MDESVPPVLPLGAGVPPMFGRPPFALPSMVSWPADTCSGADTVVLYRGREVPPPFSVSGVPPPDG
ncbi:hypothetical protein [Actinoplanes palleronii]|uniref:hypothetical protein n=1 Tax=Actinoplanes palleronii TaxID=113570 RepID=UPI001940E252|nr:hypothetical protein [Actinoplanes palleronii]